MKVDLKLVDIDDLIAEIFNRCENTVIITSRTEDVGHPIIRLNYDGGAIGAIGLCKVASRALENESLLEKRESEGGYESNTPT